MKLSQFKFNLPDELIASHPTPNRDDARLMIVNRKTGEISHHIFSDILGYYNDGDVMVFNDTRVFPAYKNHLIFNQLTPKTITISKSWRTGTRRPGRAGFAKIRRKS